MKQVYIVQENNPHLLLFFAGWAADETPFKQYRPKGMDYMICYDYRTLDFDTSIFDRYEEVNVVSWSMGVWVGSIILSSVPHNNIFSIRFNGSTYPISDSVGIPLNTFNSTLDGLTPASLQKFLRRMCKDSDAYQAFMQITPRRDFDEIKEELARLKAQYFELLGIDKEEEYDEFETDEAFEEYFYKYNYIYNYNFVGKADRIFPPENLKMNYEEDEDEIMVVTNCAHYDESMFRLLLQDMWEMTIREFDRHLKKISVE